MKNIDERLSVLQKKKDDLAQKKAKLLQEERKLKAAKSKKERNERTKKLIVLGAELEKRFSPKGIEALFKFLENEQRRLKLENWFIAEAEKIQRNPEG